LTPNVTGPATCRRGDHRPTITVAFTANGKIMVIRRT
jgi:hypothetical protein